MPVLTAVSHRWESRLAEGLGRCAGIRLTRRCADLAELLGAVAAGVGQLAVVSVDLRGLDRGIVTELAQEGVRLLGVHPPGDDGGERTLRRWGVPVVVPVDVDDAALQRAVDELLAVPTGDAAAPGPGGRQRPADGPEAADVAAAVSDRAAATAGEERSQVQPTDGIPGDGPAAGDAGGPGRGETVVVWGPAGAPGRSTVALNLAAELAALGETVVLVDADTYGACQAQLLALLDEAPGLLAAARAADHGPIDEHTLARHAPEALPGMRVLTGLPRADRWPELREPALRDVLDRCTRLARWTVVDVASCLEEDEELSFDTAAPRRNGAALVALDAADHVLAVGLGDPVGLQRLVRGLDRLGEVSGGTRRVVVNRVRSSAVGPDPVRKVTEALARFAGVADVVTVPEDQPALDAAVLRGQVLSEARPRSPARLALAEIAARLAARPHAAPARRHRLPWSRAAPAAT